MGFKDLPKVTIEEEIEEKYDGPTIFQLLYKIFTKTKKHEYEGEVIKKNPTFLMNLWLSHENDLLPILNEISRINLNLSNDKEKIIFQYLMSKVPKGKSRFIKYAKKNKKDLQKEKKIVELMENDNTISKIEATNIINSLERLSEKK